MVLIERKSIFVNELAFCVTILTFLVMEYLSVTIRMTIDRFKCLVYTEDVRCESYLPLASSFYTPEILAEWT